MAWRNDMMACLLRTRTCLETARGGGSLLCPTPARLPLLHDVRQQDTAISNQPGTKSQFMGTRARHPLRLQPSAQHPQAGGRVASPMLSRTRTVPHTIRRSMGALLTTMSESRTNDGDRRQNSAAPTSPAGMVACGALPLSRLNRNILLFEKAVSAPCVSHSVPSF